MIDGAGGLPSEGGAARRSNNSPQAAENRGGLTLRQHRCRENAGSHSAALVMLMWTISSNDVQQAKQRVDRRRVEVETRFATVKSALEAELAAIEALERVAAEFAQRHPSDDPAIANTPAAGDIETPSYTAPVEPEPARYVEPADYGQPNETGADVETTSGSAAEMDAAAGADSNLGFDILKPGSRWRLNRAARLLNPEGAPATPPPSYPPSSS